MCVPSSLSLTVTLGDLPSLPSLMIVSVLVPSGFSTVILCVPSSLSLTVTTGDLPSLPSLPSTPSLTNVRPVSVPAGSCVITHVPVRPSASSPRSVVTDGFLPSLTIVSLV